MTDDEQTTAPTAVGGAERADDRTDAAGDVATGSTDAFGDPVAGDALPRRASTALVTLLTSRFITRARHPDAWEGLLAYESDLRGRLAELFLDLVVDRDHEVAFKRQSGEDGVPVLLRREKPLSRDATFLLIHLRREHAYSDAGDEPVTITRDQVAEFLGRFHDDDANDEVRAHRRVSAAIAAVERLGLLDQAQEDDELYVVSPAIVPVVTTTELARFERVFLAQAADGDAGAVAGGDAGAVAGGDAEDPDEAFEPDAAEVERAELARAEAERAADAADDDAPHVPAPDEVALDLDGLDDPAPGADDDAEERR